MKHGEVALLRFVAAHGLLRSSVRITAQRDIPEPTAVLLPREIEALLANEDAIVRV